MQLRRLNRVITNVYDDALRSLGVKASQVNILVAAWKLGIANPLKVCDILDLDPSTLSRNVQRMRAKGWLEVMPSDDARQQPFRLTSAGRKLVEKAVPRWQVAQQQAKRLLGDGAIEMLGRSMKNLRQAKAES